MTDQELEDYAKELIEEHAQDVQLIAVLECYEEWYDNGPISKADARTVHDLIGRAQLTITFPNGSVK